MSWLTSRFSAVYTSGSGTMYRSPVRLGRTLASCSAFSRNRQPGFQIWVAVGVVAFRVCDTPSVLVTAREQDGLGRPGIVKVLLAVVLAEGIAGEHHVLRLGSV